MKNILLSTLFILILGCLSLFGLPWWCLALIAAVAIFIFPLSGGKSFATGFAAGTLLWFSIAFILNAANGGMLSAKIGLLFQGVSGFQLLSVTGLLGGLLAGFGALTGSYARQWVFREKRRRYGGYR